MSFSVDKWYLDLVTDSGTAVLGYVIDVRWLGLDVRLASCLVVEPGGGRQELMSRGETAWPRVVDDRLSWTSGMLGLEAEWRAIDRPIAHTLLSSPAGDIEWSCAMPRARATVVTPSARYEGLGYAEHLRMTMPPWAVPCHTVRWGRHVSDRHALVWIERDGAAPMRAAWLDGAFEPAASVAASGVAGLSDQRTLVWQGSRDLTHRSVGDAIAAAAPALATLVGGRLGTLREHKQVSASALLDAEGRALDDGRAIHEVVTW